VIMWVDIAEWFHFATVSWSGWVRFQTVAKWNYSWKITEVNECQLRWNLLHREIL